MDYLVPGQHHRILYSSAGIYLNILHNYVKPGCIFLNHFGSNKPGKLRGTLQIGRTSAVKSSQLSWAGQYKKYCVQYDFPFTLVCCEI